jgi:hypothetical protein
MTPFKDHGISKLERPQEKTTSVSSDSTVMIDSYRQGVEVNLVNYYLKSTKAYISSKGLARSNISGRLVPELDMRDLGQQIELSEFSGFNDQSERIDAVSILSEGFVQEDQDFYFGQNSIDGRITIFSDTGKLDIATTYSKFNQRGINADASSLSRIDTYSYDANSAFRFIDGVEQTLGIPIPGFAGDEVCLNPYKEFDEINAFGMNLNYDYIGSNDKTYSRGFSYYGSTVGTDSIAFGGRLR